MKARRWRHENYTRWISDIAEGVQRSFDAQQAMEKAINPIINYDIKYRMGQDSEENGNS